METLSLEQVKAYQGEYKVVPICRSIYADVRTPIEVLRIVKNISSIAICWKAWKTPTLGPLHFHRL